MAFLVHPLHGATNVSDAEVAEHEKHGWKRSTLEAWVAIKRPSVDDVAPKAEDAPKKPGRPRKES